VNLEVVLDALAVPADAMVEQRIPKKLLVEQGAPTAADKRQIQDGIDELKWVAALKPTNIGVPVFRDADREYLEVALLTAVFRQNAKVARLVELIHRAIPYPVLLVSSFSDAGMRSIGVSVANKRFNQNEVGKVVVDEIFATSPIALDAIQSATGQAFLASLALARLPTRDLFALYQGWVDGIVSLTAAGITGQFALPDSPEQARQMRQSIATHSKILDELSTLRTQAAKEKQMNRLVELNISIKRLEGHLAANQSALIPPERSPFVKVM
jgi:hypothetical protein